MLSMLGARWRSVLEVLEGLTDVSGHGDFDVAFCVILVKGQTTVVAP